MTVVDVDDLVVRYGAATALDHVSLTVAGAELVALIGPNGAGKSTLVNTLSGFLKPASGRVRVAGRLAHVPEGRQVFGDLTVEDNLRLGAWRVRRRLRAGPESPRRRLRAGPESRRQRDPAAVYELLPALAPLRDRRAGLLSGGEQQMVAIGRALMSRPDVLVIDELSLGLAPLVVTELVSHLRELHAQRGLAVLLIEQNARLALSLCSRGYVLEAGRVVAHGPAAELAASPRVAAAYLGSVEAGSVEAGHE